MLELEYATINGDINGIVIDSSNAIDVLLSIYSKGGIVLYVKEIKDEQVE